MMVAQPRLMVEYNECMRSAYRGGWVYHHKTSLLSTN